MATTLALPLLSDVENTPRFRLRKKRHKLPVRAGKTPDRSQSEALERYPNRVHDYDVFADHWLCESPRRVQFERTTLGIETQLSQHLDTFYNNSLLVDTATLEDVNTEIDTFIEYLYPRIRKLGNKLGFKILEIVKTGSTFDDTFVVSVKDIDLFVVFKKPPSAMHNKGPGYKYIPLRKYVKKDGAKPDQFRFGRSTDGLYLSPAVVSKNIYDLVDRALKLHSYAEVHEYLLEDGKSQIIVTLKGKYNIQITPAAYIAADDSYLVTRPYCNDENPQSDAIWRVSHIPKENLIMQRMDSADRGVRRKAYKLLKGLVILEPTLDALNTYHLKTVLLNTFDDTVDHILRWQKDSVETCFMVLLQQLQMALSMKLLPNFFIKDQNLLLNMHSRICNRLYSRVTYLLVNQHELLRVLRKRSMKL